jgi:hypothetical protein
VTRLYLGLDISRESNGSTAYERRYSAMKQTFNVSDNLAKMKLVIVERMFSQGKMV